MVAVDSSFIATVGYNSWSGTLVVVMRSGQSYEYHNVPYSVYIGLITASSPGAYYNEHIKGKYP
jgi:hypothetical protein